MSSPTHIVWTDELRLELEALLNQAADNKLSAESRDRLQEILLSCREARQHYVRFCGLECSLAALAGEAQVQEEWPRRRSVFTSPVWRISRWVGAAALLVGLGVLAMKQAEHSQISPETNSQVLVAHTNDDPELDTAATLLTQDNCLWGSVPLGSGTAASGGEVLKLGGLLREGQRLILQRGVAELGFDCGARLVMQGPSELLLKSPWEAHLIKGLVRANVPPEAIGFRVSSAEVDVVDLGTEFSVATDELTGVSDVLVHEGKVQVKAKGHNRPKGTQKALLLQNQGLRFIKNGGVKDVAATDANWQALAGRMRPLHRLIKEDAMLWTFDPPETLLATVQKLTAKAPAFPHPMPLGAGKFGQGLVFAETATEPSATPDLLLSPPIPPAPPTDILEARSFAAWVKVDPAANLGDAGTWLAHAPQMQLPGEISFRWNGNPSRGVAGAATLQFGNRTLVGTTPLLDGKWHHVAGIFVVKQRQKLPPGLDMNMRLYVDGKLEVPSAKLKLKHHEQASSQPLAPGALKIGNNAQGDDPFLGQVDEILMVDRPLSQHELAVLIQESGRKL